VGKEAIPLLHPWVWRYPCYGTTVGMVVSLLWYHGGYVPGDHGGAYYPGIMAGILPGDHAGHTTRAILVGIHLLLCYPGYTGGYTPLPTMVHPPTPGIPQHPTVLPSVCSWHRWSVPCPVREPWAQL